jgi:hypothetical protein
MGKVGTKSVKPPDPSKVRSATEKIAEGWKEYYEEALEGKQRRERSLSMLYLVWMTIDEHTKWKKRKNEIDKRFGIGWRQLNRTFTKHSLSVALSVLLGEGLIERIEDKAYKGRGCKPTRYFALHRPFVTYHGYYIRETPFFGLMRTRTRKQECRMTIKDKNSREKFPFKNVVKGSVSRTRFVRLFPEERKTVDSLCKEDQSFAAAAREAQLRRKKHLRESRQVENWKKELPLGSSRKESPKKR